MVARRRRSAPTYLVKRRGKWHGRFRDVDSLGQEHWVCEISPSPLDYQQSLTWAAGWRLEWIRTHEAELREAQEEKRRSPTLGDLLGAYEADCKERGTRWDREASRAKILQETLGIQTSYMDLTPIRIVEWRARLRAERRLSARSLNAYVTLLQAALNLAVRRGTIPVNPLRHLGKLPEASRIPEALSVRQVQALIAALAPYEASVAAGEGTKAQRRRRPNTSRRSPVPLRGIVLTCYYTMARTGNVLTLRWEDVDLERGEIVFPRTKTGRRLVVPIRAVLAEHLARIHPGPGAAGFLWPNPRTGRSYVDVAGPWRALIRLANAALAAGEQIPQDQRLYSLRHSGISHLLLAGAPAQVVAQLAGNSIGIIQRHYAHLHDDGLRRALEVADASPLLQTRPGPASGRKRSVPRSVSNRGQKRAQMAGTGENEPLN
jgi:integrase